MYKKVYKYLCFLVSKFYLQKKKIRNKNNSNKKETLKNFEK